jgi:hypothetical protein
MADRTFWGRVFKWDSSISIGQWVADRIANNWVSVFGAGGVMSVGAISAWVAAATDWIAAYGPIGWWAAAIVGALAALVVLWLIAQLRILWAKARAISKWQEDVDGFNPLDPEISRRRIRIQDLANPISRMVMNKRLIDCELLGPANIVFTKGTQIQCDRFLECEFVVFRPDATLQNVVHFYGTHIVGGIIQNCVVFVTPSMVPTLKRMGADFLNPPAEIGGDTRPLLGTGERTPQ